MSDKDFIVGTTSLKFGKTLDDSVELLKFIDPSTKSVQPAPPPCPWPTRLSHPNLPGVCCELPDGGWPGVVSRLSVWSCWSAGLSGKAIDSDGFIN